MKRYFYSPISMPSFPQLSLYSSKYSLLLQQNTPPQTDIGVIGTIKKCFLIRNYLLDGRVERLAAAPGYSMRSSPSSRPT